MRKGQILIDVNDVVGKRLGKLRVLCYLGDGYDITSGGERRRHYYVCECACGNLKKVRRSMIKNEMVHSCGCIKRKRR